MSIFTIADLHLSTRESTNKSMEVFGSRWTDYIRRLENSWKRLVADNDTVIIPGDVSWALSLGEAEDDLKFLDSLPGKKILGKGNHDFWWCTMKKHEEFFREKGISTISFLFNNAHAVEKLIIAGTRGWYHDEDAGNQPNGSNFEKLTNREALRLKTSLTEAKRLSKEHPDSEIVAFTHFPPYWNGKASENIISILNGFGVKKLYFGHIHGNYTVPPKFEYAGIEMNIVSADYLSFVPKIIL